VEVFSETRTSSKDKAAGRNRVGTHGRVNLASFRQIIPPIASLYYPKKRLFQTLGVRRGKPPLFTELPRSWLLGNCGLLVTRFSEPEPPVKQILGECLEQLQALVAKLNFP
jgi:hypothetical protein